MAVLTGKLGQVSAKLRTLEENQVLDVPNVDQETLDSLKSLYGERYIIKEEKQGNGLYSAGLYLNPNYPEVSVNA